MDEILVNFRKELHQFPEVSGEEWNTARRIVNFANRYYPPSEILENVGGAGIVLIYNFKDKGPSIGIRCELDALPITENNDFPYRSINEGVSHKCGHDGHMTIVAGIILWLKANPLNKGSLILIFQPAEESGEGAKAMLSDERFLKLSLDNIFALHNIPGAPMHSIICLPESFSPSVCSARIHLKGKVTHASTPEEGVNPAIGLARIVAEFDQLNVRDEHCDLFALLTPVCIDMGQRAYGISAGAGELHYTIRAWTDEVLLNLKEKMLRIINDIAEAEHLVSGVEWFEEFPAAKNDPGCHKAIINAGDKLGLSVQIKEKPFRFGEDFGWFSKHYCCGMFGLGAGEHTPALHDDTYDFPDELIATGVEIFAETVKSSLV